MSHPSEDQRPLIGVDQLSAQMTSNDLRNISTILGATDTAVRRRLLTQDYPVPEPVDSKETQLDSEGTEDKRWVPNFGNSHLFINSVLNSTPAGLPHSPSLILEVGGGWYERPYPRQDLQRKNLIVGNIDMFPEWGDRQHQCDLNTLTDGLNDPQLNAVLENTQLGAVVLSHILKFLEPEVAKAIIDSALAKLRLGGKIVVLDMNVSTASSAKMKSVLNRMCREEQNGELNVHDFLYGRIQKVFNYLEQMGTTDQFRFNRYTLGLALPENIAKKIRSQSIKPDEVGDVVLREGSLVKHPVTDASADQCHGIGHKTLFPMFVECMIELEKIDPEKERKNKREHNQKQRQEKKKKKQERKRR